MICSTAFSETSVSILVCCIGLRAYIMFPALPIVYCPSERILDVDCRKF
jgi:hypothetical protein